MENNNQQLIPELKQKEMKNNIQYQTVNSYQIYLNSANADILLNQSLKSNVAFFFQNALKIDKNAIETKLSVVDAQIPYSWYLINSNNNKFYLTLNAVQTLITFPVGNYNVNTFINQWYITVGNNSIWNVTFNSITNKFNFTNLLGQLFSFSDIGVQNNSIFPIIGFSKGSHNLCEDSILISTCSVNFFGITKVNIKTSTFNLKNVDSKNKGKTRTIASIPVNTNSNGIIQYMNTTQFKSSFRNHELSSITVEIVDDFKNYIDFNNCDWTITLQIDVICEVVDNLDTLEDVYNFYNVGFPIEP